jgi:hypothetical protein
MKSGKDLYDQTLLDSLEKKYQLFLDSPNGEINVFLVLNKLEDDKSELSSKGLSQTKNSPFSTNILQPNKSIKNIQRNFDMI